jgi:hypothetical protein
MMIWPDSGSQAIEGDDHLLLIGPGLRLDGDFDDRFRG